MPDPFSNVAKASMFFAGFIMLTPHRIAMVCAPHILKRYHLPVPTVSLFIYKIHNPMELSSLITTILVNMITWMNDATFKASVIRRTLSILSIWMMFISSVVSFDLFKSGGEFGYFDKFYCSIILMTLMNGFYSNLAFGVNFNTSLYGAGVPSSGFATFMLHYVYKGLYKIYYWDDYDYKLVVVQYWFTMILLFAASILWTADQVLQMVDDNDDLTDKDTNDAASITIQIDKTDDYKSGTGTNAKDIKVFSKANELSKGYTCYKHKVKGDSGRYKKITSGATYTNGGMDVTLNADAATNVHAVYVFYYGDRPIIICVSKDGSNNLEYKYFKNDANFYNPFDKTNTWTNITQTDNLANPAAGKIRSNQPPDHSNNQDLKKELSKLTLPLIGVCIAIMISIIFVSIMIGLIISKVSSKYYGIPVALVVYTAATITLSGGTGIGELFTTPQQLSPVLMLAFSLGTVYAFYPSISPYSLVDPDSGKTIDLWIQFVSTIPTYAIAVMDTVQGAPGPGGKWEDKGNTKRQFWHTQWGFAIPYILCIHIFIRTLHFPEGLIGRYVKDNIWVAGIVGNIFNAVEEWLEAIGFAGGGKQGSSFFNPAVSQFNGLMFLTTCMITMFTKDLHLF